MKFRPRIETHLLALAISVCPAIAQVKAGTVIFGQFTKTDVVLAADSGFVAVGDNGHVTHGVGECKIFAFNGKILFALAGLGSMSDPKGREVWDLAGLARTVAAGTKITSLDDLGALGDRWANRVRPLLEDTIRANPQLMRSQASKDGSIAGGLFRTYP